MTDFEQLIRVVGTERILKLLQEVAKQAIDGGDWFKVRQITDLVLQITEHPVTRHTELEPNTESPLVPLTTLNISTRCLELLTKVGINTVTALQRYSLEDLLQINGIGEVAAKQIDRGLQEKGITLDSVELRQRWHQENQSLVTEEVFADAAVSQTLGEEGEFEQATPENFLG